jgi:hypothetical protein
MKIEDRLQSMIGKTYMYHTFTHKILSYQVRSEGVTIISDKKWIVIPITKINAELEQFLPIEFEKEVVVALTLFESGNKKSLKDLVMNNIDKLQQDPKFIDQAKALNEQVKTMIAMAKLELETIKLKKDLGLW